MAVSVSASAGNIGNTPWEAGGDRYLRPKFNDSSIYVQNVSKICSTKISVFGRNYLVNKYENHYTVACIYFYDGNTACGQWSPDSVGSYILLN